MASEARILATRRKREEPPMRNGLETGVPAGR